MSDLAILDTDGNGDGRADGSDGNGDGLVDSVDSGRGGTALPLPDSDGDGISAYRDPATQGAGSGGPVLLVLPHALASAGDLQWEKGWYIGADLGRSRLDPEGDGSAFIVADNSSYGYRLLGGYDWFSFLSIEGFYLDAGSA